MTFFEIKSVSKSFGGLQAVNRCSFRLEQGTIVCLLGPNGAGKTTIFNLITGFLKVDEGSIWYKNENITNLKAYEVAKRGISRSWQGLQLFHKMTVLANVLLAIPNQGGERIWKIFANPIQIARENKENKRKAFTWLERVGLIRRIGTLTGDLSYGEQKLLSIARLLATEADLFLLDEPIAGTDPRSANEMISLIKELVEEGKTICIVEHNLELVKSLSGYIIFLDQGQVIAEGEVTDIVRDPHLANIYFGTREKEA